MAGEVSTVRRPVLMPNVEVGMEDGRVVAFLVEVDAVVALGDPLFTVEADKVTVDVEAPVAGTVVALVAEPGTDVAVGAEVLVLEVAQ